MAEKKPSRQEYLVSQAKLLPKEQQSAAIKQINTAAKAKGGITTAKLNELNLGIEQVLYGADARGGTAGAKPGTSVDAGIVPVVDPNAAINMQNRLNWKELLKTTLTNWGLPTLVPVVQGYIDQGYTSDTASLMIQNEPIYKERFSGNEARLKAGLAPLDPQTYLGLENSYRSILRNAGVPQGFYDTADDFSTFIANDVAPAELKQRTDIAELSLNGADSFYTNSLQQMYGITKGDMLAYVLDPQRALPFINRQVQAAQFGAEAARQGLQATTPMAETYAGLGVTQQQARQGFEQVAQILPEAQRLSQISTGAQPVGFEEVTSAVLGGESSAAYKKQLQDLAKQEQSRFAGQAGVGRGSLSRNTAGQF
jgi:hypothetical protein